MPQIKELADHQNLILLLEMVRNVGNNAVPVFVITVNEGWNEEDTTMITHYEHYYFDSMETLIGEVMDGLAEVHQDPDKAPSDGPCMLKLDSLETTLSTLKKFDELRKSM